MEKATIEVRRMTPDDACACSEILGAAVAGLDELNGAARAMIASHATPAVLGAELATYFTVVALDDGRIIAFGALDGDEIKRVYVHPQAQGMGAGSAVMRELEREALHRGLTAVHVTAGGTAAAFYERLGYLRQESGEFVAGPARVPYTTMRKGLSTKTVEKKPALRGRKGRRLDDGGSSPGRT